MGKNLCRAGAAAVWAALGIAIPGTEIEPARAPQARPRLGINLAGPADWNTELPFTDVFRLSREWISQKKDEPWGKGPPLDIDERGWVKRLEPDCWAETLMCTIEDGHYPSGRYTVLYQGSGRLEAWGAASVVSAGQGRMELEVASSKGAMFLKLMETDTADPVRDIRVVMPGFESSHADNPFHPAFLARWRGTACIRFMDWMKTNGSEISSWPERPRPDDATFAAKGVALETMIDLCNRLGADAWFCMPHKADDDYIRNFAVMVKDRLNPNLKAYIEYSNEVWNNMFPQTRYSWDKAKTLGLGPAERPWEGGGQYYARRSVEIFGIWKKIFGGTERLVRVLAWQSGNTWWMENIVLTHNDACKHADALAIAPYLGMSVPLSGDGLTAAEVAGWSADKVLDHLEKHSLPEADEQINASKKIADRFGLTLIAYEGGQHIVGVGGAENNEALTALFHAANAHPRIRGIYGKYLDAWTRAGGGLFCHFSSVGKWSKWGSWGAMQYYDENPAESHKMSAIIDWARKRGQPVGQ